jgi:hypothetical protein
MDTLISKLSAMLATGDYPFAIGPVGTAVLQAAAGVATTYKCVLIGQEGGAATIRDKLNLYPWVFLGLSFSNWNQDAELHRLLDLYADSEADGKVDVYITVIDDLHGVEYGGEFLKEVAGDPKINVLTPTPVVVPFGEANVGPYLLTADTHVPRPDAFFYFGYPPTNTAMVDTACSLGINFKLFGFSLMYAEAWFDPRAGGLGKELDGVMGFGGWNEYSSAALKAHTQDMVDFFSGAGGRINMDWWGVMHFANLQLLQQAIAAAPEYSAESVRATLATSKFTTVLGESWYTDPNGNWPLGNSGGLLAIPCHPGEVMQWQIVTEANGWRHDSPTADWAARDRPYGIPADATCWGIHEVISFDHPTAPPIYPKPDWPSPCEACEDCMGGACP